MTTITHSYAQHLIQKSADQALSLQERTELEQHLINCQSCRAYAKGVDELQNSLFLFARNHLRKTRDDLPVQAIIAASRHIIQRRKKLLTVAKISAIPAMAAMLLLMINLFNPSRIRLDGGHVASSPLAAPIPTPMLKTVTNRPLSTCTNPIYVVQDEDTIDRIAAKFGVPAEEIQTFNHLTDSGIALNMKLTIPICGGSQNKTKITPSFNSTITPEFQIAPPATSNTLQSDTGGPTGTY